MKRLYRVAGALVMALTAMTVAAQDAVPRYVFYFIGDGMGIGPINAAQRYYSDVLGCDSALTMMQFPVAGMCQTYSASSSVTDSAAAGTALATGHKTRNGMLGVTPDSVAVTSMAALFHDAGYGVGIATSVAPDDATPGAFYAHVPHRSMFYEIGCQMAQCGYEFVCGAGLRGTTDSEGHDTGLLKVLDDAGVQIVRGPQQIADINSRRVLLLNTEGTVPWNIGYTIDSIANVLTLPQITHTCLNHLQRTSPDRFFMMVEGGNIDHALHANDGGTAIIEIINFNEAIKVAYDFYKAHPDETLIVVTADHDTGGLAMGNTMVKYDAHLEYFKHQRVSKEAFSDFCKGIMKSRRVYTWEDMREYLEQSFGLFTVVSVSDDNEQRLRHLFDDTFELRNTADQETLYANFNAFAAAVLRLLNDAAGLGYTTLSHTGNPVPVFAIGVGAERFAAYNNNCCIANKIISIVTQQ